MNARAAAAAGAAPALVGRRTRQGVADVRLSAGFDDAFGTSRNKSKPELQPLTPFQSHTRGNKGDRQRFGVSVAFWALTERRCDCDGDCSCGSLIRPDSCVSRSLRLSLFVHLPTSSATLRT